MLGEQTAEYYNIVYDEGHRSVVEEITSHLNRSLQMKCKEIDRFIYTLLGNRPFDELQIEMLKALVMTFTGGVTHIIVGNDLPEGVDDEESA
jgi:hypothetical protein